MLINVFRPRDTKKDWIVLETSSGLYNLRQGGFQKVLGFSSERYKAIKHLPKNAKITKVITDDSWTYYLLSTGDAIGHGDSFIDNDGRVALEIDVISRKHFKREYNFLLSDDDDFYPLVEDRVGDSEKL